MGATTRIAPLCGEDAELFAAARLRAARDQPYIAAALFSLVPIAAPGHGTFSVDRWWRVYVDMSAARRWGVAATAAVLVHEAHHVLRDHHERAVRLGVTGTRHRDWNLATDAAINDDLVDDGLPLPDPVLPRHLGCRPGGFEEAYYRTLVRGDAPSGRSSSGDPGCGSGAGGAAQAVEIDEVPQDTSEGIDPVDAEAVRRAVAHDVDAAERSGGQVPPGLVRWARSQLDPQVPWTRVLRSTLRREISASVRHPEPDWTRLDRRAGSSPGVLRPGVRRVGPRIAVVLDTSASMDARLLDAAVSELDALIHRAGVAPVPVVICDEEAARPQVVRRLADLELSGGRGTDLRIGIAAAAALRPAPRVLAVLTDGWTPWPTAAPPRMSVVVVLIDSPGREPAPAPTGPGLITIRISTP